jgi:Holliday junction resolvase RusA-like endonuclease
MRAFLPKGSDRPIVTSTSGKGLKDWEHDIRTLAAAERLHSGLFDGPTQVFLHFFLPKPLSAPKRLTWQTKKPDLDKLIRSVLDGLTPVVLKDDAIVVRIVATKGFADDYQPPGVQIEVCEAVGEGPKVSR